MDKTIKQSAKLPVKIPVSLKFGFLPAKRINRATRKGRIIAHRGRWVILSMSVIIRPNHLIFYEQVFKNICHVFVSKNNFEPFKSSHLLSWEKALKSLETKL